MWRHWKTRKSLRSSTAHRQPKSWAIAAFSILPTLSEFGQATGGQRLQELRLREGDFDISCRKTSRGPQGKIHSLRLTIWQYGDPICDRYFVQVYKNRAIFGIADGCNWGMRPHTAGIRATQGFVEYLNNREWDSISVSIYYWHIFRNSFLDLKQAAHYLLRAITSAHNKIIEGLEDVWDAGTTTILGGVLLELEEKKSEEPAPPWAFICVSVGDCK